MMSLRVRECGNGAYRMNSIGTVRWWYANYFYGSSGSCIA